MGPIPLIILILLCSAVYPALPGEGSLRFQIRTGRDLIADQLARFAEETSADLVVVGTHQHSVLERWWYGSVSEGVLRTALNLLTEHSLLS